MQALELHCFSVTLVALQEGVALTIQSFSQLAEDSRYSRCQDSSELSKADKLLGSGRGGIIFGFSGTIYFSF